MSANSKSILAAVGSFAFSMIILEIIIRQFSGAGLHFTRTSIIVIVSVLVFTPTRIVVETEAGKEYHLKWRYFAKTVIFK